jgi:hypothetical protein
MGRKTFITVTSVGYLDSLQEDASSGESNWTLGRNGNARKGDRLLLYCKAPITGFVAEARIASTPEVLIDPEHEFNGSYCVDITDINVFANHVARGAVLAALPEWGWPRQPRTVVEVPDVYVDKLMTLLKERR